METDTEQKRQHFYRDYASGQWSMSELCGRYQISRPTGYKWIDRIEAEGLKAVEDRSRAPNRHGLMASATRCSVSLASVSSPRFRF